MTKKYFAVVVVAVLALGTGYLFLRAADKPVAAPTVPTKSVTAESIAKLEMNAGVDEKTKGMELGKILAVQRIIPTHRAGVVSCESGWRRRYAADGTGSRRRSVRSGSGPYDGAAGGRNHR